MEWISVNDRLPEISSNELDDDFVEDILLLVIVSTSDEFSGGQIIVEGYYSNLGFQTYKFSDSFSDVLYWMPAPPLPNNE